MEESSNNNNIDYDPIMLTGRRRRTNPDHHHVISINGDQHQLPHTNSASAWSWSWLYNHSKIVKLVYTATLFIMYQPLINLVQMKFQNKSYSAFDTHGPFMNMSVITLYMTALTSGLLFYINDHLQSFTKGRFSPMVYVILEGVFYFSGILTPLSPTLVLLIPGEFSWIGYIIIGALFVIIVIYHWISYIKHHHIEDEFASGAHPVIHDNEDISVFHRHCP